MNYGYFDNKNKEYVITRPDTPTPWMNYLGKGQFSGIISNTAGGTCFDGDPSNRRLLRYKFNNLPKDRSGRYLYIRNQDTGEYWSPTWQPVLKDLQSYECRHGQGYSVIQGMYDDVDTEITYCVPLGANYELWQAKMTNRSDKQKNLKLFSYVEFSWADAKWDLLCHWPCCAFEADFDNGKIVVDTMIQQLTDKPMYDFFSTDLPIDGYDCNLEKFIGNYRSESNPAAVENGECTNSPMSSDFCVGVLSSSVTLAPGESRSFCYVLGATDDRSKIDGCIADAFAKHKTGKCVDEIKKDWDGYCANIQVNTPCEDMNTMLNIWHPYQAKTTFDWSRFVSYYERGVDRGFGFRDSMQDVLGATHAAPDDVKKRIRLLLSIQNSSGNARIVYYPATKESVGGGRSDDHLWSIYSVCNYIRETGDAAFADEIVPYADGGDATVLEHLEQGMEFTMNNLGPHGIPSMLLGDWNDSLHCINQEGPGNAESVFVFFQLAHAAYELIELYTHLGLNDKIVRIHEIYDYCASKLDVIWDGEWFIRAFDSYGEKYGTNDGEHSNVYLNPQTWAVISRLPDEKMQNKAMDSVLKHLYTENGFTTLNNAFPGYDYAKQGYYLFPAGARENGGIFCHSNTWAMIALTMLGRGDEAFKCYENNLPIRRNDISDRSLTEPYIYSQTMFAPPHIRAGECVNSWLTGTASWTYLAATQHILGIRPDYDGLVIDPCIPSDWQGFSATRSCRGVVCNIEVKKDTVAGLTVNGNKISGNYVPWSLFEGQKELNIEYRF